MVIHTGLGHLFGILGERIVPRESTRRMVGSVDVVVLQNGGFVAVGAGLATGTGRLSWSGSRGFLLRCLLLGRLLGNRLGGRLFSRFLFSGLLLSSLLLGSFLLGSFLFSGLLLGSFLFSGSLLRGLLLCGLLGSGLVTRMGVAVTVIIAVLDDGSLLAVNLNNRRRCRLARGDPNDGGDSGVLDDEGTLFDVFTYRVSQGTAGQEDGEHS